MIQLSGMDAAFLYLEGGTLPMHVLGIVLLDPAGGDPDGEGFSYERLVGVLEERLHLMPPFRRKLVELPLHLDRPYWIDDPDFDLSQHVHRLDAPPPGDERALARVVAELTSVPLDRSRPLWQMHVIEGLERDRVAVVTRLHHAAMYGAAGADVMAQIFDLEPSGRDVEPPDEPFVGEMPPPTVALVAKALGRQVTLPWRVGRQVVSTGRNVAATAARTVRRRISSGGGDGGDSVSMLSLAPRSALNGVLTSERALSLGRVSLDEVKTIKDAFDATVNDVVLAAVSAAVRRSLIERGESVPDRPLVASVPMKLGAGEVESTDVIGTMMVPLPTDLDDPVAMLQQLVGTTRESKEMSESMGPESFAEWADLTAPMLLATGARAYETFQLARYHPPLHNLIVSNIPGPPIALYSAGARVEAIYPFGPLLPGTGLNITVLSNVDRIDVGALVCPDLVPDPWIITAGFEEAVKTLLKAVDADG